MSASVCDCLTDDQLREFIRVFQYYDRDKDGFLARPEFLSALKLIGIVPTAEELEAMHADIGRDAASLADFISVIYYFLRGTETAAELIRAFAIFDRDGDGRLPVGRASEILRGLKHPVDAERIAELMRALDPDGTGLIDYREMIRRLRPE
jgi:calcium-binding protein CML